MSAAVILVYSAVALSSVVLITGTVRARRGEAVGPVDARAYDLLEAAFLAGGPGRDGGHRDQRDVRGRPAGDRRPRRGLGAAADRARPGREPIQRSPNQVRGRAPWAAISGGRTSVA
ncbi:hypothetical protein SANTM175S_04939 [Streptomyces antimycoticus]